MEFFMLRKLENQPARVQQEAAKRFWESVDEVQTANQKTSAALVESEVAKAVKAVRKILLATKNQCK
jgi:guanylate kinase